MEDFSKEFISESKCSIDGPGFGLENLAMKLVCSPLLLVWHYFFLTMLRVGEFAADKKCDSGMHVVRLRDVIQKRNSLNAELHIYFAHNERLSRIIKAI
jgi:hypothetical protein